MLEDKMNPSPHSRETIGKLLEAAKREDWEVVDSKLVPQLKTLDGNEAVDLLLSHVQDQDLNIRDAVATSIANLEISDMTVIEKAVSAMGQMAKEDKTVFVAGRAAAALLRWREHPELGSRVSKILDTFPWRAITMGWSEALRENVPQLNELLQTAEVRLLKEGDISDAGKAYADAFIKADVGEEWTQETAERLMRYWHKRQPDLFFVATHEGGVVGGTVAGVKPWWNGDYLTDGEIFVLPDFQGRGVAKSLLKRLLEEGVRKYNTTEFEGIANGEAEFPLKWYNNLGMEKTQWVYITGDAKVMLENLQK